MREFVEEAAVLSRWLGRDIVADLAGAVPSWTVFRFRDATVFEPDERDRLYLVRGETVREFARSQTSIDGAYAELVGGAPLPDVA